MSINTIPSLQSLSRGQNTRNPSIGALSRGRDSGSLYDLTRTHVQLGKRNSFNDISNVKQNYTTSRQELKKEGSIPSLAKPIVMRSLSVLNSRETKAKVIVKSFTHTELGKETLAEKKERQEKKLALWEKINEIKKSLTRNFEDPDQKIFPQKSSLRKVFECLEVLNETESSLSELMNLVVFTLKSAIYGNPKMTESLLQLSSAAENEELRSLALSLENNNVTYYSLVTVLAKELVKQTAPKPDENLDDKLRIQQLEQIVEEKDQAIYALQNELDNRITPEEHKQLLKEIEILNRKLQKLQADHSKLSSQQEDLKSENINMKKTIAEDVDQIEALLCKNSDLECDKDNLQLEIEKYLKKISELQQSLNPIKDFKDKTALKLGIVKKQILDLRKENEKLSNANRELNIRAACGFENLTPRPEYQKLPVWGDLEACIYNRYADNQPYPTRQVVENLTNKLLGVEEKVGTVPDQKEKENPKVLKKSRSKKRIDSKESPQVPPLRPLPLKTRTINSATERKNSSRRNKTGDDMKREVSVSAFYTARSAYDDDRKASLLSGRINNLSIRNESQDERELWEEDALDVADDLIDYLAKANRTLEKVSQKVERKQNLGMK